MAEEEKSESTAWRIRSVRNVYSNPWISVREYQTIAPTGAPAQYGLVHIRNLALGVVPIDEDGNTILIGQERFTFGRYSWELPEGGGDPESPPLEGAQRELSEEAGLKADHWLELFSDVHTSNSITDERACGFLAWGLSEDTRHKPDASENLTVRRVPFREALRMAVDGEITDAFSLVMLLKASHLAENGLLPRDVTELMLG